MKALILSRVSSKEQEEGYSIASQTANIKEYRLRKNLDIFRVFEITESSFKAIHVLEQLLTQIGAYLKATHKSKEAYQTQV